MSTRQPISSVTLSASTSSVSFTNIPQTYTDLYLVVSGNSAGGYINTRIRFNSDVGSSYSFTRLGVTFPGNNPTLSAGSEQNATSIRGAQMDNADNQFFTVNIMSYTNTSINKAVLVKTYNSDGGGYGDSPTVVTGLWRSTNAISSIIITTDGTSFASNTTFNLYGIDAQASAQAKATGGSSIYRDASYWYHIFNSTGIFTPTENLTADYLVVAGGGGGGVGGGGAGGYRTNTSTFASSIAHTITVGAGGIINGGKGSNSSIAGAGFTTFSSTGGGGASANSANGATGGSGGGASNESPSQPGAGNEGAYSPVEGFGGGSRTSTTAGGGGGGASAVGANGSGTTGGAGGNGSSSSITGSSVTYAGGGGAGGSTSGGAGGSGGGGQGQNGYGQSASAGTANTGGGGGGGWAGSGATGGSGIVIIRYSV